MREIMLTGVGGQGTVLAAKVLAQAALAKGWTVRTAETIGMAQRGGSVVSHVRMGDAGESVHGPLIARGCADLVIAFEPAEAVRVLPYLAEGGAVVTASTAVQPVTAALSPTPYRASDACACLRRLIVGAEETAAASTRLVVVPDKELCDGLGTRKALNMVLLGKAAAAGLLPFTVDELQAAMELLVNPRFHDLNRRALSLH